MIPVTIKGRPIHNPIIGLTRIPSGAITAVPPTNIANGGSKAAAISMIDSNERQERRAEVLESDLSAMIEVRKPKFGLSPVCVFG
jgi:hypothetical protein